MTETFFRPAAIVNGVIGLHRSDDVEASETREIFLRHVLRVLNGRPLVMISVRLFDVGENI